MFCKSKGGTKCKDNYWNNVDPSKRDNRTRISPMNAIRYNSIVLPREAQKRGYPSVSEMLNDVDDTDSMSCTVLPCEWCGLKHNYCRCDCSYRHDSCTQLCIINKALQRWKALTQKTESKNRN